MGLHLKYTLVRCRALFYRNLFKFKMETFSTRSAINGHLSSPGVEHVVKILDQMFWPKNRPRPGTRNCSGPVWTAGECGVWTLALFELLPRILCPVRRAEIMRSKQRAVSALRRRQPTLTDREVHRRRKITTVLAALLQVF